MDIPIVFAIILSGCFIFSGIKGWKKHANILKNGELLMGRIIRYEWYGPFGKKSLWPIIQFRLNGKNYELRPKVVPINQRKDIGISVKIAYWDKYPDIVVIQNKYYWVTFLPIILLGLFFPLIIKYI